MWGQAPRRLVDPLQTFVVLAVGVLAVAGLASLGQASLQTSAVTMLVNLTLVVGLYVFIGNSGVLSFGHMAFMAAGAYAGAILAMDPDMKAVLMPEMYTGLVSMHMGTAGALLIGGVVGGLFGFIIAMPLMRVSGLSAGLASLALLVTVNVVSGNWLSVTNGTTGISGVPMSGSLSVALVVSLSAVALALWFQNTVSGRRLRAIREDDVAAKSIGIGISRERTIAFTLSAFIVGIGGALFAMAQGAVSPDAFYLDITFLTLAMLVVGGIRSVTGAVVGTVFLSVVSEVLTRIEAGVTLAGVQVTLPVGTHNLALGLIMLLVLILRPAGLTGGREARIPRLWARSGARSPSPAGQQSA